ncbi:MAG: hypothetical protein QM770_17780 [Tepidisphaeraceae bacterium]
MRFACCLFASVASIASFASADAFDPVRVPADAAWVIHVDVDAFTKSHAWQLAEPNLRRMKHFTERLEQIERMVDVKLPDDVHGVTVLSTEVDGENAVVVIDSEAKPQRLIALVSLSSSYNVETDENGRELHHWADGGKAIYASFLTDHRLAVSPSREQLKKVVAIAAGKAEGLKADSALARGVSSSTTVPATEPTITPIVYAASRNIAELATVRQARARLFDRLESGWVILGEQPGSLALHAEFNAVNWRSAQGVKVLLNGAGSMISMVLPERNANLELFAELLETMQAESEGAIVKVNWPIAYEKVEAVMKSHGLDVSGPTTRP